MGDAFSDTVVYILGGAPREEPFRPLVVVGGNRRAAHGVHLVATALPAPIGRCAWSGPGGTSAEKQCCLVDEAEPIAVGIEAVERSLAPRTLLDRRDLTRASGDGSPVYRVEFLSGEYRLSGVGWNGP